MRLKKESTEGERLLIESHELQCRETVYAYVERQPQVQTVSS